MNKQKIITKMSDLDRSNARSCLNEVRKKEKTTIYWIKKLEFKKKHWRDKTSRLNGYRQVT